MKYPEGKTPAQIQEDVHQEPFKKYDLGYIDGYVQATGNRAYAVFVRKEDGVIGFVPLYLVKALFDA